MPAHLAWEYRRDVLMKQMKALHQKGEPVEAALPDIICLEELSDYWCNFLLVHAPTLAGERERERECVCVCVCVCV